MSAKVFLLALLLVTIAICSTTVAAFDGDIEGLEGPSPFLHIGSKISEIGERYGVKRPNEKSLGKLSFPAPPPLTPSENLSLPIPKIKKNKKVQRKRLIKRLSKKLSKEQRKLLKRILKRIRNNRKIRRLNKKNKKVKNYKKKQTKKVKPLIKKFKKTLPKKQRKLLRKVIKRIKKAAQKKRSQKKRSQKKGSQKKGSQKKVAPGKKTTKCALPVGKRPDLSKCEKPVKPKVKKVAAKPKDKCPIPNVVIKGPLKCPSGRYMVVTRRRSCLRIDGRCHVIIRRECIRDKSKPVQKRVAVGPTRCDLGFELRQTRSCNETVCVFTRFCTAQNVILPPVQPVYNFTGPVKCPKGERLVFQRDDAKKSFTRFCVEDSGLLATQRCQITGDPHIRPFRGSATSRIFTYMGKGDFVLAESYDKSFIVHGRFRKWKGGSVLSGVAILINGIDKVSYTASRQAFYLNGVEWNPRRNTTYQLPNGGTIHIPLKADAFRVRSANGARVLVTYHIAGASEALPNANRGILNTEILAPLTFRWSRGLCTRTDFVRRKLIHAPGQASGIFRRIEQVETEKDNHDGQAWLNMAYRKKARAYCKKKFGDKTKAAYKNCMIDFRYSWNTYLGRRLAQFTKGFYTHANKFNKRWFVREKLSPIEITRRLRRRIRYLKLMVGRYTKRVNRLSKSKNDKIARLTRRFKRQYLRTLRRIVREKQSKIRVYSRHFIIHLKKVLAEFEDEGKREEYRKKALDSLDVKISRAEQKVRQYVNKQLTFLDRRVRAKVKAAFAKDDKCTKIEKKLKFTVLVLRELKRQLKVLRTRAVSMFKMSGNDAQVLRRRAIARLQQRIVDKQLHVKEFKKKFLEQLEQKLEAITDADAQEKARQNALAELKKITNEKQQAIKRYTVASLHRIDRFYRRVLEETKKLQYAQ